MIKGYYKEDTGLKNKHVEEAIRILNSKKIPVGYYTLLVLFNI